MIFLQYKFCERKYIYVFTEQIGKKNIFTEN